MKFISLLWIALIFPSFVEADLTCPYPSLISHEDRAQLRQKYEKAIFKVYIKDQNVNKTIKKKEATITQVGNAILVSGDGHVYHSSIYLMKALIFRG